MSIALVSDIFQSVQGEGVHTGVPMNFVRFAGCNLKCDGCDTMPYMDTVKHMSPMVIMNNLNPELSWVCITGGEPTQQPKVFLDLIAACHTEGFGVAVESNGTAFPCFDKEDRYWPDWLCVSPKTRSLKDLPAIAVANEVKIPIGHEAFPDMAGVAVAAQRIYQANPVATVLVQPWLSRGSGDGERVKMAYHAAMDLDLRLSVQVHKLIGVK